MRIVVFSDGTGNSSAKLFRTNVWRLYEALDLSDPTTQVAYYDNGVGTAAFKPLAVLGGAFGFGLKRNVRDLYMFLCRNYTPGDDCRISAFGFSRGAFTIRVLLGLIRTQGLVRYHHDERELKRMATWAYRRYRAEVLPSKGLVGLLRVLRDAVLRAFDGIRRTTTYDKAGNHPDVPIAFVGLWDTVAAYGLPIIELTRGWDRFVWPLSLPTRRLSKNVRKACHALALDDERQTFHPLLWTEEHEPTVWQGATPGGPEHGAIVDERVSQVWFSGMHSNVGGGYPDDGMAHDSLVWIARHAEVHGGLILKPEELDRWQRRCTPSAPMADSRAGVGAYYRYMPRLVQTLIEGGRDGATVDLPKVHASVINRIGSGVDGYAPVVLPPRYAVTDGDVIYDLAPAGTPAAPHIETRARAAVRHARQQQVWDAVWYRRIAYFATVAATVLLALSPLLEAYTPRALQWPWPTVSGAIGALSSMLPAIAAPLLTYFQTYPAQLVVGGLVIWGLMRFSSWVEQRNADTMRKAWQGADTPRPSVFLRVARAVRTSGPYVKALDALRYSLAPTVFGLAMLAAIVIGGVVLAIRLSHDVPLMLGRICTNGARTQPVGEAWHELPAFDITNICQPMSVRLAKGERYEIQARPPQVRWLDKTREVTTLKGFASDTWVYRLAWPIRRHRLLNWFVPVARIGEYGDQYVALTGATTEFSVQVEGPLFMYVNDALWFYPSTYFYDNNGNANDPMRWFIRRLPPAD